VSATADRAEGCIGGHLRDFLEHPPRLISSLSPSCLSPFKLPVNPSAFHSSFRRLAPYRHAALYFVRGNRAYLRRLALDPAPLARYVHACVPSRCRGTSFVRCLGIYDFNSFNHHFMGIAPSISFHLTFGRLFIPVVLSYLGVTVWVCLPLNSMLSDCYF